ncbi:RNA-directed DNA polymerase, eukaryota [Tanacetum coccineum]
MYRSKEDELAKLSSSIFVTNFLDKFYAKELWTVCKQYGTVVDTFIPDRRSKAGKRRFTGDCADETYANKRIFFSFLGNSQDKVQKRRLVKGGIGSWFVKFTSSIQLFFVMKELRGLISRNTTKEVSGWMPDFEEDIDQDSQSDDKLSNEGSFDENRGLRITPNVEGESDLEEVAETIFEKEQASVKVKEGCNSVQKETRSEDPFNIYDLLDKKKSAYCDIPNSDDTLKYPPGFTPETDVDAQKNESKVLDMEGDNSGHKVQDVEQESVTKNNSPLNSYKNDTERSTCSGHFKKCDIPRSGGSILQLMEELIKVGQTMGYNMEGCITNIGDIINSQGANDGEWAPNGKKLIIISVYAPQELREKKMLWDYLILVLKSWNGDVIIMGDFNEVRTQDERHGSIFNAQLNVRCLSTLFISTAGLEESHLDRSTYLDAKSGGRSLFRGIQVGSSLPSSHLFYADDAVFMCQRSVANVDTNSQRQGDQAAKKIRCGNSSSAYLVLGSLPIYHMSLFKVPTKVLLNMESIRCHLFNGIEHNGKKPIWVKWNKVLASKEKGGLGVSSFYALNRALYSMDGQRLVKIMEGITLFDSKDRWRWSLEGCGEFTVASVRNLLDANSLPVVSSKTRWIKAVPIKVNIHAGVKLDILPTR